VDRVANCPPFWGKEHKAGYYSLDLGTYKTRKGKDQLKKKCSFGMITDRKSRSYNGTYRIFKSRKLKLRDKHHDMRAVLGEVKTWSGIFARKQRKGLQNREKVEGLRKSDERNGTEQ